MRPLTLCVLFCLGLTLVNSFPAPQVWLSYYSNFSSFGRVGNLLFLTFALHSFAIFALKKRATVTNRSHRSLSKGGREWFTLYEWVICSFKEWFPSNSLFSPIFFYFMLKTKEWIFLVSLFRRGMRANRSVALYKKRDESNSHLKKRAIRTRKQRANSQPWVLAHFTLDPVHQFQYLVWLLFKNLLMYIQYSIQYVLYHTSQVFFFFVHTFFTLCTVL